MKYIDYDWCWCANSIYKGDGKQCTNDCCFRHIANKPLPNKGEVEISTWSELKDCLECPGYIQEVE